MNSLNTLLIILLLSLGTTCFADMRDPTVRPTKDINHNISPDKIFLDMIYISDGYKTALINGHSYHEGEYVGPNKIQHIDINSVTITSKRKTYHIRVNRDHENINLSETNSYNPSQIKHREQQ